MGKGHFLIGFVGSVWEVWVREGSWLWLLHLEGRGKSGLRALSVDPVTFWSFESWHRVGTR